MQLINGSRVVIVGGGPAGSFTALHLLYLSAEAHLDLDVIITEVCDALARPWTALYAAPEIEAGWYQAYSD